MEKENELAAIIIELCFRIHRRYGPGLFESVYERILNFEINKIGLKTEVQKTISLEHDELKIPIAFRADIIVEECLLLEIKSVDQISNLFYKQVVTYLKLTELKLGLLINFNVGLLKNGIERVINNR